MLIDKLAVFTTIYLPFFLSLIIWYSTSHEVNPVPHRFFLISSKVSIKLNRLFFKVFSRKIFLFCSYFPNILACERRKLFLTLVSFLHAVQKPGDSVHVRDATFGVWLWPQVNWCIYITDHSLRSKFSKGIYAIFCVGTSQSQNVFNLLFFFLLISASLFLCLCL